MPDAQKTYLPAETILHDRYRIILRIGGGIGSVYKAADLNYKSRVVAVKEMIEIYADDAAREKAIVDFKRECERLAKLEHPSIPTIYDYFFDPARGRYYLVMKFIDGGDLAGKLKESSGKVDELCVTEWAVQTCDVLDYIHSQEPPIIYRDLKPANLMVDKKLNRVMLVDFGIARFVAPQQQKGVTAIGTMGYAPPELFAGNVEPRSDIYSLGATMFHLLTGNDPQDNPLLIFDFPKNPPPRIYNPDITPPMEEMLCRAVEYKPENRFESAREFGKALQAHLDALKRGVKFDNVGTGTEALKQSCFNCGQELKFGDTFCAWCGSKESVSSGQQQQNTVKLIVMNTTELNAEFSIPTSGELLIGRIDPCRGLQPEIDLSLYDLAARVSRRHAKIVVRDGRYFIVDLNSANGTVVNGHARLIPLQPYQLTSGDEVRLGETVLRFVRLARNNTSSNLHIETGMYKSPQAHLPEIDCSPALSDKSRLSIGIWSMFRKIQTRISSMIKPGLSELSSISSPKQPETTVQRHTDISFPAKVPAGKFYNLHVQIVPAETVTPTGIIEPLPKRHAYDVTMSLTVPQPAAPQEPPPPIRVTVSVAAENFDIEGETRADIIVPLEGKSNAINFRLCGQSPGAGRIMIDFAQDGRPVGSVDLSPEITAENQFSSQTDAQSTGEVAINTETAPAPDVLLKVFEFRHANEPGRLHFVLSSSHPQLQDLPVLDGDLGTVDLRSDVAAWVENQLGLIGSIARKNDVSADEVSRVLSDVGNNLFDQLLPQPLKELCWTLRQRDIKTLLVLSDEPHIPWELIKPWRADPSTGAIEKEDSFWGESFQMTRWLRGRPPAGQFSINRTVAIATTSLASTKLQERTVRDFAEDSSAVVFVSAQSASSLQAAEEELQIVRLLTGYGAQITELPLQKKSLQDAFSNGGFDLLHVATHGSFGGKGFADASALMMEDGTFSAAELSPRMAGAIRKASPLIFFNACHSGRTDFSLTKLGSWGGRLIDLGCGGFIGTLWPVSDQAAVAFARAFYNEMSNGVSIGQAMVNARLIVHQQFPNDPSWLAYCCFGDSTATVRNQQ